MDGPVLFLPCAAGVEELLLAECRSLLGRRIEIKPDRGGVRVHGDATAALRLNLESRLAQRVLWLVADGHYRDEDDLYDIARAVRWSDWITPDHTLRVDTTAHQSPVRSLNFASLRIKDGVCDRMRDDTGERPSVDVRRPDLQLLLHLRADFALLYVDLSGEPLFKRGWREDTGEAPLKETLAAAMLAAAGWQGRAENGPLLDPCCGAGTIAIEAAQLACGIAPGAMRDFAFQRLLPFRDRASRWAETWEQLSTEARDRVHAPAAEVHAGDVSFRMTDFAQRNAQRAGVAPAIQLKTVDALQRLPPAERGTMILNPPYGERLDPKGTGHAWQPAREQPEGGQSVETFFNQLAAHWKRQYPGWTAWVLSPDAALPRWMRLKESRRVPLWNGPIECRLFRFDMVAGSARAPGVGKAHPGAKDGGEGA
jgi:putative N6-adenine-specific DNA methylase